MDTEHSRAWIRGLREAVLVAPVFSGIYWIFFGKFLTGEYSVANFQDNTHFILPLFAHISKTFAAGEFPYWINTIAGGIPLYNTPQFSLLYPFYFFGWDLYRNPVDTSLHVHYLTLLHVAILWLNTYVMMRVFRLRIIPSILGATLFAFCANTYAYLFWVNVISPYSWLPLAVASVFLILENAYPKTGLVLGWISIYLLTAASPAQPLIHFAFCSAVLVFSYAMIHRRLPLRNLVLLGVGSIILASPTLVPSMVFAQRDMMRWTEIGAVVGNQRLPIEAMTLGQTRISELAKVLFPISAEQILGDSYLGVLPVLLALFAIFKRKQNWLVIPLFCLAIYTILSSTGTNSGLAYVNYYIPLLNKIREPARHLYLFGLAVSTLAAFGFEHLTSVETFRKCDLRSHAIVFGVFLVLLLGSFWVRQRYTSAVSDSVLIWCFGMFLVILLTSRLLPRVNGLSQAILAAIVVYPMLSYSAPIRMVKENDYFASENLRSHRVLQEVAKIDDIGKYRLVVADSRLNSQFWSMNASYYELRTFQAFVNPLPSTQTVEMFGAPATPRYAELLGAKYHLSCDDAPGPSTDYVYEREIERCRLYSTPHARPHYFLSTGIASYSTVKQFFDGIQEEDSDLNRVFVPSEDTRHVSDWVGGASVALDWETLRENSSANAFDVVVKANRRSIFVLNEYYRKDWQATVNGKSEIPFKVNLNQIALLLPEGTTNVHFQYEPRLFVGLRYVQRVAFALLAVGLIAIAVPIKTTKK